MDLLRRQRLLIERLKSYIPIFLGIFLGYVVAYNKHFLAYGMLLIFGSVLFLKGFLDPVLCLALVALTFPFRVYASLPQLRVLNCYRLFLILAFISFGFKVVLGKKYLRFQIRTEDVLLSAFLVIVFAGGLWAQNQAYFVKYVGLMMEGVGLYFLVKLIVKSKQEVLTIVKAMWVAFGVILIVGFAQAFFTFDLPYSVPLLWRGKVRLTSFFHNSNDFGLYLSMFIPGITTFIFYQKSRIWKIALIGLFFVSFFCLLLTRSRVAFVATLLGLGSLFFLLPHRLSKRTTIFSLLLLLFLVLLPYLLPLVRPTIYGLVNVVKNIQSQAIRKDYARWQLLVAGTKIGSLYPLAGVGAGNFKARLLEIMPNFVFGRDFSSHNFWVELWANFGIIGFLLFSGFYFSVYKGLKSLRLAEDQFIQALSVWFRASLIGFVVGCLGPSGVMNFLILWLFLGLGSKISSLEIIHSLQGD